MNTNNLLEKITAWAKRRGFVFPASEIYGGLANTYDYGPYGTQLKENLRLLWWKKFISEREDVYPIDSTIIMRPEIWQASGHTANFADVMVEDKVTRERYRADHLIEDKLEKILKDNKIEIIENMAKASDLNEKESEAAKHGKVDGLSPEKLGKIINEMKLKSPNGNELSEPKRFNQLFETEVGIVAGEKNKAYLRGEIAQGLFMNFKNIIDSMHPRLPFGIGQVGKAFRNEITPGKFTFRTLEFDLMEFEYFFDPEKQNWEELFEYWKSEMQTFALSLGIKQDKLRWRPHEDFERSHYSSRTEDLEYSFPWGFKEMWGLAYRSNFDLKNHSQNSGKDLSYIYPDGSKLLPHVIEPTFGLSRLLSIIVMDAYTEETVNDKTRVVLKFHPSIAPVQVAVFPLQRDEKLLKLSQEIYSSLRESGFRCEFDNSGNIGKMYRKQDEIGTPYCVTIDYQSLEDKAVTVRDRDTMEQRRVKVDELAKELL